MGKKSRRKQRTPAAAKDAACHTLLYFEKLAKLSKSAPEKALNLEPKVLDAIEVLRITGVDLRNVYVLLGDLYKYAYYTIKFGGEGCDKAVAYYVKARESRREIDSSTGLGYCEVDIIKCCLQFDRYNEAVKACKGAVSRSKAHHPGFKGFRRAVLQIAEHLKSKGKFEHMFDVLHFISDEIERHWEPEDQKAAYNIFLTYAGRQEELNNAIIYAKKLFSLAQKQDNQSGEVALYSEELGMLYIRCHKHRAAMHHFSNALAIEKKLKSKDYRKQVVDMYIKMGWVYLNRGAGNEQSALELFEAALSKIMCLKDGKDRHVFMVSVNRGKGLAYYDLGPWDRAIEAFEESRFECEVGKLVQSETLVHLYLGRVRIF